jgi:hypothetical protein
MTDYLAPTPVWVDHTTVLSDLTALGLSEHLVAELLAWQRYFDEHFSTDGLWNPPVGDEIYATTGRQLHDRLTRALPGTEVTLDLWPVEGSASRH